MSFSFIHQSLIILQYNVFIYRLINDNNYTSLEKFPKECFRSIQDDNEDLWSVGPHAEIVAFTLSPFLTHLDGEIPPNISLFSFCFFGHFLRAKI